MGLVGYFLYKKAGGAVGSALDERSKQIYDSLSKAKQDGIKSLESKLAEEKAVPEMMSSLTTIFEVRIECVGGAMVSMKRNTPPHSRYVPSGWLVGWSVVAPKE